MDHLQVQIKSGSDRFPSDFLYHHKMNFDHHLTPPQLLPQDHPHLYNTNGGNNNLSPRFQAMPDSASIDSAPRSGLKPDLNTPQGLPLLPINADGNRGLIGSASDSSGNSDAKDLVSTTSTGGSVTSGAPIATSHFTANNNFQHPGTHTTGSGPNRLATTTNSNSNTNNGTSSSHSRNSSHGGGARGANHQQQLSIHSVGSIIEPVTPPSAAASGNSQHPSSLTLDIDKDYLLSLNKVPLSQLKSDILRLSKDQYGCRFLQKRIDENLIVNYSVRYNNFEIIFNEIYLNLYELIIDPFGNYLIQKLIKYCSNENLNLMLEILQSNLFQISINQHGTRALQKIIENLNSNYQLELLVAGLKPFIIELIKDLNGNHVIQKILNKFPPLQCQFIYDSILSDLFTVATHKHGCCVLQKCLNHVTTHQLNQFINEILNDYNFNKLINDQFGNYVLQYLISINNYQIHYKFYLDLVKFNLINYCNLKFSSNVIEKFIKNCYNNEVVTNGPGRGEPNINFVNLKFELIYHILKNPHNLNKLINDPFGNYVIQTLIDHAINPSLDYGSLKPKNLYLLINPLLVTNEMIKYDIISIYFQNCKIVSSFGKRIQLKISMIVNNTYPCQNFASSTTPPHNDVNANAGTNASSNVNVNANANVNANVNSNEFNDVPVMNTLGSYSIPSHSHSYSQSSSNSINHSNSNSISSLNSRSNSFPSVHSRSNSLQLPQFNPNYVFDNQVSNNLSQNLNNLHLNNYYTGLSSNQVPTVSSIPPTNSAGGTSSTSVTPNNSLTPNPSLTPNLNPGNTSLAPGMNGFAKQNLNPNMNSSMNMNGGNFAGTNPNYNVGQNFLKTPQVFSNAPFNEYVDDSTLNFNLR